MRIYGLLPASLFLASAAISGSHRVDASAINPDWVPLEEHIGNTYVCLKHPSTCLFSSDDASDSPQASDEAYNAPSNTVTAAQDITFVKRFEGGDFALGPNFPGSGVEGHGRHYGTPKSVKTRAGTVSASEIESLEAVPIAMAKKASWLSRHPTARNAIGVGILGGTGLWAYTVTRHMGHLSFMPDSWRANIKEWVMTSPDKHRDPLVVNATQAELSKLQRRDSDSEQTLTPRTLIGPVGWAALGAGAGAYGMNMYNEKYPDFVSPALGGKVPATAQRMQRAKHDVTDSKFQTDSALAKRHWGEAIVGLGAVSGAYGVYRHYKPKEDKDSAANRDGDNVAETQISKRSDSPQVDKQGHHIKYNILSTPDGDGRLTVFSNIDGSPSYVLWQRPKDHKEDSDSDMEAPRNYTGPIPESSKQNAAHKRPPLSNSTSARAKMSLPLLVAVALISVIVLLSGPILAVDRGMPAQWTLRRRFDPAGLVLHAAPYHVANEYGAASAAATALGASALHASHFEQDDNVGHGDHERPLPFPLHPYSLPDVEPEVAHAFEKVGERLNEQVDKESRAKHHTEHTGGRRLQMHFLEGDEVKSTPDVEAPTPARPPKAPRSPQPPSGPDRHLEQTRQHNRKMKMPERDQGMKTAEMTKDEKKQANDEITVGGWRKFSTMFTSLRDRLPLRVAQALAFDDGDATAFADDTRSKSRKLLQNYRESPSGRWDRYLREGHAPEPPKANSNPGPGGPGKAKGYGLREIPNPPSPPEEQKSPERLSGHLTPDRQGDAETNMHNHPSAGHAPPAPKVAETPPVSYQSPTSNSPPTFSNPPAPHNFHNQHTPQGPPTSSDSPTHKSGGLDHSEHGNPRVHYREGLSTPPTPIANQHDPPVKRDSPQLPSNQDHEVSVLARRGMSKTSAVTGSALGLGLTGLMVANMVSSVDLPSVEEHKHRRSEETVFMASKGHSLHANGCQHNPDDTKTKNSPYWEYLPAAILLLALITFSIFALRQVNTYLAMARDYRPLFDIDPIEKRDFASQRNPARLLLLALPAFVTLAALALGTVMATHKAYHRTTQCSATSAVRYDMPPRQFDASISSIDITFEPRIRPPKGKTEALIVASTSSLAAGAGALATGLMLADDDFLMREQADLAKRDEKALDKRDPAVNPWVVGSLGGIAGAGTTTALLKWDARRKATGYGKGAVAEPFRKRLTSDVE